MRKLKISWLLEDSLKQAGMYGVIPEDEKELVKDLREKLQISMSMVLIILKVQMTHTPKLYLF